MLNRLPNIAVLSTKSNATNSLPTTRGSWMQAAMLGTTLTALLAASTASAQYRAWIQGTVADQSGAAITNAELSLTDLSTNLTTKARADGHGTFHFNQLPADKFRLVVSASGFASKTLNGVTIIPEQPNTINVSLAVGSIKSEVSVNAAEVPAPETATASISGTITSNEIQHLPSFDRDVFRLDALAPGTFGDEAQSNTGNAKNMPGENQRRRPPPTFEPAPSPSNANARNVNFNFATTRNGTSYMTDFVEPVYAAVAKVAYSATDVAPAPGLAIARNSFNGPSYQDLDLSLAKGFHIPENQILGDSAMLEFRVDAYNVLNLTELTPTPTTSITSTNFGANTSALGSRTVQIQSRFSF